MRRVHIGKKNKKKKGTSKVYRMSEMLSCLLVLLGCLLMQGSCAGLVSVHNDKHTDTCMLRRGCLREQHFARARAHTHTHTTHTQTHALTPVHSHAHARTHTHTHARADAHAVQSHVSVSPVSVSSHSLCEKTA